MKLNECGFLAILAVAFAGFCWLMSAIFTPSTLTVGGVTYHAYGLVNQDDVKNPKIRYEVSAMHVVVGILYCETVIVPVYIVGWDLWEPVGVKTTQEPH